MNHKTLNLSFSPRRSSLINSFFTLINRDSDAVMSALGFIPTPDFIYAQTSRELDRLEDLILEQVA